MGSLASALRPYAADQSDAPRVYVDANLPAGLVGFMRHDLRWDVLFVLEHDDLRRASDRAHFHRACDLGRTLITLDRDFFDDRAFPADLSPGVIVCSAPDERNLMRLLRYVDRTMLRTSGAALDQPLKGRKISLTPDVLRLA
jgi:predicted nuclease of predicted toxin-antitoxin system